MDIDMNKVMHDNTDIGINESTLEWPSSRDKLMGRHGCRPNVALTNLIKQKLLIEKSIGYYTMRDRVHSLWKPSGSLDFLDIELLEDSRLGDTASPGRQACAWARKPQ
ncbi:unnamed protein product [Lupinus luteus]|uniref:Uncharacterized protein n=1 Tax=Lupinus luteus TaxID=3873 RepID=A0AAV1XA35_LUPLU